MKLKAIVYTVVLVFFSISLSNAQKLNQTKPDFPFVRIQSLQVNQLSKATTNSSEIVLSKYSGTIEGYLAIHPTNGPNDYFAVRYEIPSNITSPYTLKKIRFYNNDDQTVWPRMLITHGNGNTSPDLNNPIIEFNNISGPEQGFLTLQTNTAINSLDNIFFVMQLPPGPSSVFPGQGSAIGVEQNPPVGTIPHQQGNLFSTNGTTFALP